MKHSEKFRVSTLQQGPLLVYDKLMQYLSYLGTHGHLFVQFSDHQSAVNQQAPSSGISLLYRQDTMVHS